MRDTIEIKTLTDDEIIDVPNAANENAVGRIAAPNRFEATSSEFCFWIKRGITLEENQIIFSESDINGEEIKFYALVDEIRRTSRRADMTEEYDIGDGDVNYEPPFSNEGFSYAHAQVLRIAPEIATPPIERSIVSLGEEAEAKIAYGFDEISRPMAVGLLKNGRKFAGNGLIDLDYLLGENGGHLNVNGMAGVGTKTTFLLTVIKSLQKQSEIAREIGKPFFIVPIILNVKGEDLMWLDRKNSRFKPEHETEWHKLGIAPEPFTDAKFYTAKGLPVHSCSSTEYSWSLQDVLNEESMLYIFSEDDNLSANMTALVREIVADITEKDGKKLKGNWKTWRDLLNWMGNTGNINTRYGTGTWWAVYRRLWKVLDEGKGIFPKDEINGKPIKIVRNTTSPPQVTEKIFRSPQTVCRKMFHTSRSDIFTNVSKLKNPSCRVGIAEVLIKWIWAKEEKKNSFCRLKLTNRRKKRQSKKLRLIVTSLKKLTFPLKNFWKLPKAAQKRKNLTAVST